MPGYFRLRLDPCYGLVTKDSIFVAVLYTSDSDKMMRYTDEVKLA
jgi:hypothetical protein